MTPFPPPHAGEGREGAIASRRQTIQRPRETDRFHGIAPLVAAAPACRQAAFRFGAISLRAIRHSAIWIALRAAPLRKLSDTHHNASPLSTVGSSRTRLT